MPSLADILAAQYGGQPVYEGGPDAEVTPAGLLSALGGWGQNIAHQAAPGLIPRTGARAPQFTDPVETYPDTPRQAAAKLSAKRGTLPDPLEVMLGVAGGPQATFIAPGRVPGGAKLLAQADKMLRAGKTPEEVRQATGINLNTMGQTQYEVSDAGSTFRMPTKAEIKSGGTLGQFLTNWKAGELVPELNQIPLVFSDPTFTAQKGVLPKGFLDLNTNPPTVGLNPAVLKTPEEMRDAVLHEAGGHGASRLFGYPSGGSPYGPTAKQVAQATLPARKAAYENVINQVSERAGTWALKQAGDDAAKAMPLIERYFELNPAEAELMKGALVERSKFNRGRMLLEEQFNAYERIAGEEQARVIQKSKDMTQAELRASDPEKRSDRPYSQQLVVPQRATPWSAELPSFTERMVTAKEIAAAARNAPAYKTARAPTVTDEFKPLLRSGETRGDVMRALGAEPIEESIADLGRNAYRGFVPPEPPPSIADIGRGEYLARLGGGRQYSTKLEPTTEMTPIGEQFVLPGAEQRPAAALQRAADAPLKPTVAQKEPGGLFGDTTGQGEMQFLITEPYDFLTGTRPGAPYPQFAEQYPKTRRPTMVPRDEGPGMRPEKTLTREAEEFAKTREKIIKEMRDEGYQPFFDPSQRFPAEFSKQPGPHVDTTAAVAKKQATIEQHLKDIDAPEALKALREAHSRGLELPDSQAWYFLGQLERKAVESLGEEAGRKWFRDNLATGMATTTTGMNPQQNLIMAQYLNYLRTNKLPFPTASHQTPVTVGGQRTMPNIQAYREAFESPGGAYESLGLKNPKRTDFAQAQMGNPSAFTVDEQMAHGMLGVDVPKPGTYGLVTRLGREEAARSGIDPQNYQDVSWAGFKKMLEEQSRAKKGFRPYGPGEGYQGQPMISVINDMIERTHRITGMPRQEIFERGFLRHQIPLYGIGGAVTLGSVLMGQSEPAAQ